MRFYHEATGLTVDRPEPLEHKIVLPNGGLVLLATVTSAGYQSAVLGWTIKGLVLEPHQIAQAMEVLREIDQGLQVGRALPWPGFLPVVEV